MNNCVADTLKNKDCICKFLQELKDEVWIEFIHEAKKNVDINFNIVQRSQYYYLIIQNYYLLPQCIKITSEGEVSNIFDCSWINDKMKYIMSKYKSAIEKETCLNISPNDSTTNGVSRGYMAHFKLAEGSSQAIKDMLIQTDTPITPAAPVEQSNSWCIIV